MLSMMKIVKVKKIQLTQLSVRSIENINDYVFIPANHGYDNAEKTMHAFFTATGPMFRKNFYMKRPFFNIDIYALISYILELDVSLLRVKPNGTLSTIMEILDIDFSRFQSKVRRELLKYFIPETKILQQTDENIQN